MNEFKSKIVESNQIEIHEDLVLLKERYTNKKFKRPITRYSHDVFTDIKNWLIEIGNKKIILDVGCGVGQSTYVLCKKYPDHSVIGIDKSIDRVERKNSFKANFPSNGKIFRADILDLWRLLLELKGSYEFTKQYILYPNPYPKKSQLKKRWHGNPIFPFILEYNCPIELRSNWKLYLEEFSFVCRQYQRSTSEVESFIPKEYFTPFEKKYSMSGQNIYKLIIS